MRRRTYFLVLLVIAALIGSGFFVLSRKSRGPSGQAQTRCFLETTTEYECWLIEDLKYAGYEIAGDTGSAIVASINDGREFCIWHGESEGNQTGEHELLGEEGYRVVSTIAGTDILGDGIRLTWVSARGRMWAEDCVAPFPDPENPPTISVSQVAAFVKATR